MGFLSEAVPQRHVPLDVLPGISRIVADNPGIMTYHGTNSYLVETPEGLVVIDPGPDDAAHIGDLITAIGARKLGLILLTHTHGDHYAGLPALAAQTGAKVAAFHQPMRADFNPDLPLRDGDKLQGFTALHTPGHAADHLCFAWRGQGGEKILFSGDHVMSWSSSIVSPPDGDMADYYRGLERLLGRDDDLFLPGHGPLLRDPRGLTAELLGHRQRRERSILEALKRQDWSVAALAADLYAKADPFLKAAAQRNVLAHLLKLSKEGLVHELTPAAGLHADNLMMLEKAANSPAWRQRIERMAEDSKRRFALAAA
ncbi:MBL fold metallo-hydrolase [Acidocella sp. MX-AZ02]|uniref:MBL fold metallo-hydrolase n=2 Tax=unclassified Acidocella TaxID=2648610 RepID=UPI00028DE0E1|nr:MBL fold metallo-hydrolase [Acidocella sp. MX-AZ02]EKN00890.1 hypothetical protein MXAZACID_03148 [Acidocella sp. MX-AZ02]